MNIEQIVASTPYRIIRHWEDGTTSEIRCPSLGAAEREKERLSKKMGLLTSDGNRCIKIEIQAVS